MKNFRFIDLFCGGGGSITGEIAALKQAGVKYEGRGFNHWNLAIETIKANHPEIIPDFDRACADIRKVATTRKAFLPTTRPALTCSGRRRAAPTTATRPAARRAANSCGASRNTFCLFCA